MTSRNTEDRGTVLESTDGVRARAQVGTIAEPLAPAPRATPVVPASAMPPEVPFRPTMRPPTPRLVVLDDGDQVNGEVVRLREATTHIGRTEGEVRLPHDPLVSAKHAEIVREGSAKSPRWILRDLSSANGTFVRCGRSLLRHDRLLVIGSRRLKFRPVEEHGHADEAKAGTVLVDMTSKEAPAWPALVETVPSAHGRDYAITGVDVSLGRPGHGNAIEIDDAHIAPRHARVFRGATGAWTIEALPSLNGVWVQIVEVELSSPCRFQIGEQRFIFVV